MTTIPVPVWVLVVMTLLISAREFFSMRRDEAIRDLFKMYLKQTNGQDNG